MAMLARETTGGEYGFVEQELQDRILSIYGTKENEADLFRPDLADQHKVGFFTLDRCSQTDVTEIVDLKEMTEVLQILLQDVATLRRDINFTKHVMQADYESKLQEKSLELYCRINEKVLELEKVHEERVGTVRRAFRQQLSDAISRIAVLYNKNLARKMKHARSKHEGDAETLEMKYKELQLTLRQNESVIHMLKMQIQQLQMGGEGPSPTVSDRPSAVTPQTPSLESAPLTSAAPSTIRPPAVQVHLKSPVDEPFSKSPSVNHEAELLKEELDVMVRKSDALSEALQAKEDENLILGDEIQSLQEKLEESERQVDELRTDFSKIRNTQDEDRVATERMIAIERQRMQKHMEEKMKLVHQQATEEAWAEFKEKERIEKEKMKSILDQKRRLEEQLAQERMKNAGHGETDVDKLKRSEQLLREEVERLKREIERINRTWEKKFAILQQSLHALKDESYLRQTLQRQAAALHHAAVSYSADTPLGIVPSSKRGSPSKRPLPEIQQKFGNRLMPSNPTPAGGMPEKDYISYTVSAPSGRGTAVFSVDENQVMSDNDREDIPSDVVPLPNPPSRKSTSRCADDERPASKDRDRIHSIPPHIHAQ